MIKNCIECHSKKDIMAKDLCQSCYFIKIYYPKNKDKVKSRSLTHKIRGEILSKNHKRCCVCGHKRNLQIHHIKYSNNKESLLEDTSVFCSKCHDSIHTKKKRKLKFDNKQNIHNIVTEKKVFNVLRLNQGLSEYEIIRKFYKGKTHTEEYNRWKNRVRKLIGSIRKHHIIKTKKVKASRGGGEKTLLYLNGVID